MKRSISTTMRKLHDASEAIRQYMCHLRKIIFSQKDTVIFLFYFRYILTPYTMQVWFKRNLGVLFSTSSNVLIESFTTKKTRTAVFYHVFFRGRSPRIFTLDKTRAVSVLKSFKNDPLLVVFAFSCNF